MSEKSRLLLGAHMSIAGGLYKSFKRGESIDCTTMQIFTHSNRRWDFRELDNDEILKFKSEQKETNILPIIHASYLINLCSDSEATQHRSRAALEKELKAAEELGIKYLVLHPGYGSKDKNETIKQLADYIDVALSKIKGSTEILLENMAGQKNSICSSFEELAEAYSKIHHKSRIGFCLDTCHAWAYGYDFSAENKYYDMWKSFESIIGLNNLKAIHLNDSKKGLASKADRHERIGKGKIGITAFELIINDKKLAKIPKILEVPFDTLDDYKKDIELLKSLIRS